MAEQGLVEPGLHDVAAVVLEEVELAGLRVAHLDQFALGRAQPDGEHFHADVLGFLDRPGDAFLVVFPIGHQHEYLVVVLLLFKRADGFIDRFAKRGAALGDDIRAE